MAPPGTFATGVLLLDDRCDSLTLENVGFRDTKVGAIYNYGGGAVTIKDSSFRDMTAKEIDRPGTGDDEMDSWGRGAAVLSFGGRVTVKDSLFENLLATHGGGAITVVGKAQLVVEGCKFSKCKSSR